MTELDENERNEKEIECIERPAEKCRSKRSFSRSVKLVPDAPKSHGEPDALGEGSGDPLGDALAEGDPVGAGVAGLSSP